MKDGALPTWYMDVRQRAVTAGHIVVDKVSADAAKTIHAVSEIKTPTFVAFDRLPKHNQTAVENGDRAFVIFTNGPKKGEFGKFNTKPATLTR